MSDVTRAVVTSWTFDPWFVSALAVTAAVYVRGWRAVHAQMPDRMSRRRLAAFLGGLGALFVAVASPLDAFAGLLLSVHMVQHLLLMAVAPPLLLLGAPLVPLLRGLPPAIAKEWLAPVLTWRQPHPAVCWGALVAATWLWHVPALYQLALRSPFWHEVEHATFFAAALLFWWPVVQPWPGRARWPRWIVPVYLLLADVQNTVFAALLTFSERLLYPVYATVPRLGGLSALDDQVAAGLVMWVPGSIGFLVPAALITVRLLSPRPAPARARAPAFRPRRALDLLRLPGLGAALRRPATRRVAQGAVLLLAVVVVADGFLGPAVGAMNLAGVLPWTGWRALVVLGLLVAGNVFCFACPFTLPRELARRVARPTRRWPRALRSKWLAVGVLAAAFWAVEAFALWDAPRATAGLIVAYFAIALAVDMRFRGAAFCKYVCPIGQFHFVHALVSPFEVRVRAPAVCAGCTTHDCLRGNDSRRGCELELFLPRKAGNLDCTFCLDCVHACPHDNVGVLAVAPGGTLVADGRRSSIGRLSQRLDVAALGLLLVTAAFAMAAVMVMPLGGGTLAALLAVPPLGMALLAAAPARVRETGSRLALALVPLGLAMWCAHFVFHLATGASTMALAARRAAADLGIADAPHWSHDAGMLGGAPLGLELVLLDAGLLLALWLGWRIARDVAAHSTRLLVPYAGVATALWAAGVWIACQPMAMRGTMAH